MALVTEDGTPLDEVARLDTSPQLNALDELIVVNEPLYEVVEPSGGDVGEYRALAFAAGTVISRREFLARAGVEAPQVVSCTIERYTGYTGLLNFTVTGYGLDSIKDGTLCFMSDPEETAYYAEGTTVTSTMITGELLVGDMETFFLTIAGEAGGLPYPFAELAVPPE